MQVEIIERKIVDLPCGSRVSYWPGQIEDADSERGKLAVEAGITKKLELKTEEERDSNG